MISYQKTLTSKVEVCTEQIFNNIISSDAVAATCRAVAELRARQEAAADDTERRRLHDEQARVKKKLPAFLFMANFPGGRRRQQDARLNGIVMVDFDNVDNPREQFARWGETGTLQKINALLVHVTPSGRGLRVVAKADAAAGNLADNQAVIAAMLGMQPDAACKDASRISFAVAAENILYINKELFTYENKEYDEKYGALYRGNNSSPVRNAGSAAALSAAAGNQTCARPAEADATADADAARRDRQTVRPHAVALTLDDAGQPVFKGIRYKDIIAEWWRQQGGVPVVGERNQKLHRLAANLRYICDNSADALLAVMPALGLEETEMRSLVESAVKLKMYGSVPRALRKVLDALGLDNTELPEDEGDMADAEADFLDAYNALKLPPVMQALTAGVPANVRIGAMLAALPMMYTLASRVTFTHYDGTETRLSGMTFVIGPAASGKSFILSLDKLLMEPVRVSDKAGRKIEQEYRDAKELNKNKQKQMEKPHPVIRITPIQISNTMLALRMRDAVDSHDPSLHLHVYSCEAELATALRAQKGGSWIEKNDIYCKSFHNEYWGMDYANDQAVNGEIQVNLNLVISGTEDAFDKLIPTSTVLSGLPTRLMYFQMPQSHYQMITKGNKKLTDAQAKLIKDFSYYLDTVSGHVDARALTDAMYKWCAKIARRAELEEDEELDDLRKRTAIIGERAGVLYALVAQRERYEQGKPLKFGKDEIAFAEFVADYCLYAQYHKFAARMKEQKQRVVEVAGKKGRPMKLVEVYNALPKTFTLEQLMHLRPNSNRGAAYGNIAKWKAKHLIEPVPNSKQYIKLITKI